MEILKYKGYLLEYPKVSFYFSWNDEVMIKWLKFKDIPKEDFLKVDWQHRDTLLHHIGLAMIPGFYNMAFFDQIEISAFQAHTDTIDLLSRLLDEGLRELKYRNGIDLDRPIHIQSTSEKRLEPFQVEPERKALTLHGGGKDSAVAGELLKEAGFPFDWFVLRPTKNTRAMIQASGVEGYLRVRQGSENVLNQTTVYPGHRPFSSLLFFISLVPAVVNRYQYIVVGNEYTAEFGNVVVNGKEVNHQYPKTMEFEKLFNDYIAKHVVSGIRLFSILRTQYEYDIARTFCEHPEYFPYVRSCNIGRKKEIWCKKCPKCVFIYILFAAFCDEDELKTIFGELLHELPEFRPLLDALLFDEVKPFECVGPKEEVYLCLANSNIRALRQIADNIHSEAFDHSAEIIADSAGRKHLIPEEILRTLRIQNTNSPQLTNY